MDLRKVVVIGAGTMGSGIAQWFAQAGTAVELVDASEAQLRKALAEIHGSWDKLAARGKLTGVEALKEKLSVTSLDAVDRTADLVVEAIVENLEVKKNLFRDLDEAFAPHTVIASNTSSFPIALMAQALTPSRKPRFLGLHFFNPATVMKLVEVIKGADTDEDLCRELYRWFDERDKKPALCKDSPGFIVNRVARNFYGEPLRIADSEDEARLREIDFVLKEVGGFKMGPFELMDLIGIDVNYSVTCSVFEAYDREPRFAPHPLQKKLVDEKRFGRKSKRGFYTYD
jgi:3-hydroxybutyryl-CoA dehydrogenase